MRTAGSAPWVPLTLFFLLLLLQPVQWYAISKFYEPYPTLTFPVFAGSGKLRNAQYRAWEPTFTAHWESGRVTEVPRGELFAEVPESARWAIIHLNFGPDKLAERDPREESDLPTSWLPGRRQLWRQIGNPARAREAAPWLQARLEEMYVGQRAVGMTIQWPWTKSAEAGDSTSTFIEFSRGSKPQ